VICWNFQFIGHKIEGKKPAFFEDSIKVISSIDEMNKVKINFVKDRPGHDIRYALNSNKIKKTLK
jgi:dTDP-D-glucose 4,6-dehydratase